MSKRPDWASGPEWAGWASCVGCVERTMKESDGDVRVWRISENGWIQSMFDGDADVTIATQSPNHALTAANALAEAAGGK